VTGRGQAWKGGGKLDRTGASVQDGASVERRRQVGQDGASPVPTHDGEKGGSGFSGVISSDASIDLALVIYQDGSCFRLAADVLRVGQTNRDDCACLLFRLFGGGADF
jgi:hypothetical protein